jgi:three-Cys-motif partner protein
VAKKKYDWDVGKPPPPLDAHSRAKHQVLCNYLRRYIEIVAGPIQSEGLKLTLVDGFAGGGEYLLPDGSIWHGSPIIMLNEVESARIIQQKKRTKPFKLDAEFIFIEKRNKSAAYLDAAIRRNNYGNKLVQAAGKA